MNTGGFGIPTIINYGNGGSTLGMPPAIDHRIYVGGPLNFRPPSLTIPPRLPIIEKLTPRSVNANATIAGFRSRASVAWRTNAGMVADRVAAQGRALALRARTLTKR